MSIKETISHLVGGYSKAKLDELLNERTFLKSAIDDVEARLRELHAEQRCIVASLQAECRHDEGCREKYIPDQDTYGRSANGMWRWECLLCDAQVDDLYEGDRYHRGRWTGDAYEDKRKTWKVKERA